MESEPSTGVTAILLIVCTLLTYYLSSDENGGEDEPSQTTIQLELIDEALAKQQQLSEVVRQGWQKTPISYIPPPMYPNEEHIETELKEKADASIVTIMPSYIFGTLNAQKTLYLDLDKNNPPDYMDTWIPFAPPYDVLSEDSTSSDDRALCNVFSWPDYVMHDIFERFKTFVFWPISFLQPRDLSKSGFYYLGSGDKVRCAFCNIEIHNWKEGDDAEVFHKRASPQCPFILSDRTGNVPASINLSLSIRDGCGVRAPGPVNPSYASEFSRLRSFKDWPKSLRQKSKELVEAGFYYTGQSDKTKCFYCDLGLKDWEKDSVPWKEHARWFGNCAFVQLMRGLDYVQKVKFNHTNVGFNIEPGPATTTSSKERTTSLSEKYFKHNNIGYTIEPGAATTTSSKERTTSKSEKDFKLCKICFLEERNVCFVPCGHVVACEKCTLTSNHCPVCRRTFTNAVRLYFA